MLVAQPRAHHGDIPDKSDSVELSINGVSPGMFVDPRIVPLSGTLGPSNVVGRIGIDRDVLSSDPEFSDLHLGCLGSVTWREGFAGRGMQYIVVAFVSLQWCFVARWADLSDTTEGSEPVRLEYQLECELAQCSPTYLAQSTKDVEVNRLDEI